MCPLSRTYQHQLDQGDLAVIPSALGDLEDLQSFEHDFRAELSVSSWSDFINKSPISEYNFYRDAHKINVRC